MAFSRRLGVVSILGACWFVAVGCGDDEDRKTGTEDGGEGGEGTGTSGSGGKSSIAGSLNIAGKGGTTAGSGGSAGNTNTAGEGGSGGDAGGGGIVAGAGGETLGVGGEGGAPGGAGAPTAGAGGEGGAPEPTAAMCKYQCDGNEDCTFGADDVPHRCDLTTGSCAQCFEDVQCLAELSIWFTTCDDDTGCTPVTEACVAADGVGYCATLPDAATPEFPCSIGIPRMLPRFGALGNIEVCAADARCFRGTCDYGCRDTFSAGCGVGNGDTCSPTTGLCECALGTECDTGTCGADSHCAECATSDDCLPVVAGRDTCVDGTCGCGSVNSCTLAYVGNPPKLCE